MFWLLGLVALIVVLIVVIVVLIVTLRPKSNDVNAWTDAVDVENIMGHLVRARALNCLVSANRLTILYYYRISSKTLRTLLVEAIAQWEHLASTPQV
jgi:hypothetical protein